MGADARDAPALRDVSRMTTVAGITFRPIQRDDLAAISRVHWRACRIAYTFMNWSYSEADVYDWYATRQATWDWGLVASDRGTVAGFIAACGSVIDQLFIDPHYQRRGIGKSLLTAAIAELREPQTLHVFEANTPARLFYASHGFKEVERYYNEAEGATELIYRRHSS
jgi:ribosomal protein S18 acetylase RimI-like enzyme